LSIKKGFNSAIIEDKNTSNILGIWQLHKALKRLKQCNYKNSVNIKKRFKLNILEFLSGTDLTHMRKRKADKV